MGKTARKSRKKLDKITEISPSKDMIGQFIALYKARKDPSLAKGIASEMIVDGVIDRASWPITIAKFWMGVAIIVMTGLGLGLLIIAAFSHWTVAIPAIPLGGAVYGLIRIWKGVNIGVDNATRLAKAELSNRTANRPLPSTALDDTPEDFT